VVPKPILTLMNLSFPLATSDLGAEALENEFMMNSMHLFEVRSCNLFKSNGHCFGNFSPAFHKSYFTPFRSIIGTNNVSLFLV